MRTSQQRAEYYSLNRDKLISKQKEYYNRNKDDILRRKREKYKNKQYNKMMGSIMSYWKFKDQTVKLG